jgi:hypothetical protein
MIIENIQKFLIGLQSSILAIIKVVLLSKFKTEIHLTKKDKECVILGNGPSLSELIKNHKSFLDDKDVICVNHFPISDLFSITKPSFYITSAPEFWLNNLGEAYIDRREKLFKALGEKTQWPLKVLIPFSAKGSGTWESHISKNINIEIIFYNCIGIEGFKGFVFWLFKRNLAMPRPHNVLLAAIFTAINMGYKNIYLWGAENNQFLEMSVDDQNTALLRQKHFYDAEDVQAKTMKKAGIGQRRVHEILHKFMLSFEGYHILREYANTRNVKVVNQTPGSMIDAFDREII